MMDWLRKLFKALPLDAISERLGEIVAWWSEQVAGVPASELPTNVYIGASFIVCVLWYFVARMLPKPLGGMSWVVIIAVLLTPGPSFDGTNGFAPACAGVAYSILMKDLPEAAAKSIPIMMIMMCGFLLGFVWQLICQQVLINIPKKPLKLTKSFISNPFNRSKKTPNQS